MPYPQCLLPAVLGRMCGLRERTRLKALNQTSGPDSSHARTAATGNGKRGLRGVTT